MKRHLLSVLTILGCLLLNACGRTNALDLKFGKGVDKRDVKINMEVLADNDIPVTPIFTGQKEFAIPNGYGENEWYFTYKNCLKGYFRHFKTNQNNTHTYRFSFRKTKGKYYVDADITGMNDYRNTIELK